MPFNFSLIQECPEYFHKDFHRHDLCRFCSSKNAKIPLSPEINGELNQLLDNIKYCLGIEIQLENQPKMLCDSCKVNIDKFSDFKKLCLESEERLIEIVKTEDVAADIKDLANLECLKSEKSRDDVFNFSNTDSMNSFDETELNDDYKDNLLVRKPTIKKKTVPKCKKPSINSNKGENKKYIPKRTLTYCNICRIDLECEQKYVAHNLDAHGIESNGYRCFGCEKKFKSAKTRLGHEINFCKGLRDGYKCSICERFLPKRRSYEAHMRCHRDNVTEELPEDIFKCKHCLKSFKTKDSLSLHLENHGKKRYVCETCGRVFSRQDYLHKHKMTHTGVKGHVCPHCSFRAAQRSSLIVHIRKHTGERPYSCEICSQRCISSSNLIAHQKRHLGVKKYECTICLKKFAYKRSLDEHVACTHERSAPHPCHICGATYTRPRGLKRHLSAKHGDSSEKSIEITRPDLEVNKLDLNKDLNVDKIIITTQNLDSDQIEILKQVTYESKDGQMYVMKGEHVFVV